MVWSQDSAPGLHPLSLGEDMGCQETQEMVLLTWSLERSELAARGMAGVQGARLWCGAWLLSPKPSCFHLFVLPLFLPESSVLTVQVMEVQRDLRGAAQAN